MSTEFAICRSPTYCTMTKVDSQHCRCVPGTALCTEDVSEQDKSYFLFVGTLYVN
jgi:hypothetical protein